jgi:hypothetical protein
VTIPTIAGIMMAGCDQRKVKQIVFLDFSFTNQINRELVPSREPIETLVMGKAKWANSVLQGPK